MLGSKGLMTTSYILTMWHGLHDPLLVISQIHKFNDVITFIALIITSWVRHNVCLRQNTHYMLILGALEKQLYFCYLFP